MPPAIIGGVIAGVGALGAAKISSNATSKAAKTAAAASDQSAAVQQNIYDQNRQTLSPYVQTGIPATGAINSLLGLPGVSQPAQAPMQPNAMSQFGQPGMIYSGSDGMPQEWSQWPEMPYQPQQMQPGTNMTGNVTSQFNPQSAFDNYRNSTGYQFRLGEGMNALNSGWAGRGSLKSGAAMKDAIRYGQDFASGEFGNYLGQLGNQQEVGLRAAGAQAGVGVQYGNALGNIYQNKGDNAANAALLQGQNTGQLVNSLATIGSGIFGQQASFAAPTLSPAYGGSGSNMSGAIWNPGR